MSEAAKPRQAMTAERWHQIRNWLADIIRLPVEDRPIYLAKVCVGDSALRAQLESLIAALEIAEDRAFEKPVLGNATVEISDSRMPDRLASRRIGAYYLEKEIARGGMGTVWRAARADDRFHKTVAIKILDVGRFSTRSLELFRSERQILANLEHPNISRLLDAGETEDGLPYFVMEYVEGESITKYCAARRLTIDERLGIFQKICSAVHYAHQNLVIHRDLKPQNIVVTASGEPKLLDFGIAKVVDASDMGATVTVLRVMTPAYASPEQICGKALTTATDTYSLGLLLYELLTGRYAYEGLENSHDRQRAIVEDDPKKPSHAVFGPAKRSQELSTAEEISNTVRLTPEGLSNRLRGDLENIIEKAIRKQPGERYTSVAEFSEDIQRHLDGIPVIARQHTLAYRAGKFMTRHRAGALAAGLAFTTLLTGVAVTTREAQIARAQSARAERRFNDVRKLANSLMFEVHDSIRDLPGTTQARKLLITRALEYLDSLSSEASGDPSLQRELAEAYDRVGDVLGNNTVANLGDLAGASQGYAKAVAIRESLANANPTDLKLQTALFGEYWKLAWVLKDTGDLASAQRILRRAVPTVRRIAVGRADPVLQNQLAGSYWLTAQVLEASGDFPGALENYRMGASIREPIATGKAPNVLARQYLVSDYFGLAKMLVETGKLDEAMAIQTKSLSIIKQLSDADPTNAKLREYLAEDYDLAGTVLQKRGDLTGALKAGRQGRKLFAQLADADPSDMLARANVGWSDLNIAEVLMRQGHIREAVQRIHGAIATFQKTRGSKDLWRLTELGQSYSDLGMAYAALAERGASPAERIRAWRDARSWYEKGLDIWTQRPNGSGSLDAGGHDQAAEIRRQLARCDANLQQLRAPTLVHTK